MRPDVIKFTLLDIAAAAKTIEASELEKAAYLREIGTLTIAKNVSKAIALLDISKTARAVTGNAAGDAYLDQARELLLKLLGVIP